MLETQIKVTLRLTVIQSVSLSVEPHLEFMTRYYYCLTVTVLFLWGVLSDERTGLSFVCAAGLVSANAWRVSKAPYVG
jgi:hypothetical protein